MLNLTIEQKYSKKMTKILLSDVSEIFIGIPISRYKFDISKNKVKVDYKLFSQNMLSNTGLFQPYDAEMFCATRDLSAGCTQAGDVVYGMRKPNDAVYINSENAGYLVQSYMAIIRCDKSIIIPEYLAFKLNTNESRHQLYKNIQGATIPLLKIRDIKDITLEIPSLEQQAKIVKIAKIGFEEIEVLKELINAKTKLIKLLI